jgi:hypothetical protein
MSLRFQHHSKESGGKKEKWKIVFPLALSRLYSEEAMTVKINCAYLVVLGENGNKRRDYELI